MSCHESLTPSIVPTIWSSHSQVPSTASKFADSADVPIFVSQMFLLLFFNPLSGESRESDFRLRGRGFPRDHIIVIHCTRTPSRILSRQIVVAEHRSLRHDLEEHCHILRLKCFDFHTGRNTTVSTSLPSSSFLVFFSFLSFSILLTCLRPTQTPPHPQSRTQRQPHGHTTMFSPEAMHLLGSHCSFGAQGEKI